MGFKQNLHNLKEKYKGTKMAPAFNAIHTFLYLPNETTHGGTHIKAADDLKRTMNIVIMALIPCLFSECLMQDYQHYVAAKGFFTTECLSYANFLNFDNFVLEQLSFTIGNHFLWSGSYWLNLFLQ